MANIGVFIGRILICGVCAFLISSALGLVGIEVPKAIARFAGLIVGWPIASSIIKSPSEA